MEKVNKKSTGFYPTPSLLVRKVISDYFSCHSRLPDVLLEPSAGHGDFIIHTWEEAISHFSMNKRALEKLVEGTILFENEKTIYQALRKNIELWCIGKGLKNRPQLYNENFLLEGAKLISDLPENTLVVGNPPWDEFTTRKHDGLAIVDDSRKERLEEKHKYQALGFKNVYQSFLHEILNIKSKNLGLVFILPRQLLGDLSAESLRKRLVSDSSLDLTVYCNKDEPDYYFNEVARTAEILCLQYKKSKNSSIRIRRGFHETFHIIKPYGADCTLPCPFKNGTEKLLSQILNNSSLADWAFEWEVTVSRGKVDYTSSKYSSALNGRTITAYQFEQGDSTDVILNKILPDSKRKLKAAVLKTRNAVSDSMLRINCKNEDAHPYLMLLLNSRPVELALRAVISNINLNNFRLLSLPIPQPDRRVLAKANSLCKKCVEGKLTWEQASDQLAIEIYGLTIKQFETLEELFPDRKNDKVAA